MNCVWTKGTFRGACPPPDPNAASPVPGRFAAVSEILGVPSSGVCTQVRKRRINAEHSYHNLLSGSDLSSGGGKNKESWSQTFLKMDSLCMLKFYSSLIGISRC